MITLEKPYVKGDAFTIIGILDKNITGWKIRCEIFDCANSIKLATENSGGSDEQIKVTNTLKGEFIIQVEAGLTKDFDENSFIEIEIETNQMIGTKPERITVLPSTKIQFKKERIDWETP